MVWVVIVVNTRCRSSKVFVYIMDQMILCVRAVVDVDAVAIMVAQHSRVTTTALQWL